MNFKSIQRVLLAAFLFLCCWGANAQHQFGNSRVSGDFGFNGMYYIPDTLIGAEPVDSKVRGNAFLNLLYTNGGFSAGARYEFYMFPLIDFEKIGYRGQGIKYFFADYTNKFISVTAGNFYEQFGNGLTLRAYEDRQLGIDNSLLGARVKATPYKGIYLKGVWGIERDNLFRPPRLRARRGCGVLLRRNVPQNPGKGLYRTRGGQLREQVRKIERRPLFHRQ
jgi:hypothetical protein